MATCTIRAEMSGFVVSIEARVGDVVSADDVLLIMESMKMEMPVVAPAAGRVTSISPAEGDPVTEGQMLAVIETEPG